VAARVEALDWTAIGAGLDAHGCAVTGSLLTREECALLSSQYDTSELFRRRVVMAAHGFGRGEYQYFAYPLPQLVAELRTELYRRLAPVAGRWSLALGTGASYPPEHEQFLRRCHEAAQTQPTPLMLRYGPGDFNCLHQDLYGDLAFPLQVVFLLSDPASDFTGGEFALTEQRPRMQSRVEVVNLQQGEGLIFAVSQRPVRGSRGVYRVTMRHGVSRLKSGRRYTLGVIFHDAR
jgi:hypothetical protein